MKTKHKIILGITGLIALIGGSLGFVEPRKEAVSATILFPRGGGTGTSSVNASDVGKYLKVSDDSPFTYSFDNPTAGSGDPFPFTQQSYGVSTSTLVNFIGGIMSTASSTFQSLHVGALDIPLLTSALLVTNGSGVVAEYAGSACTNQAVTAISALGASTCTSLTSAYFADADWGDITIATGVASVEDDSHAHTGTTLSGIDISADTNLAGDTEIVLTGDALSIASTITRDTELPVGANPTGSLGLSAVNGVATTFMRSDGAPALSQGIIPTWTGLHTFNTAGLIALASSTIQTFFSTNASISASLGIPNGTAPVVDAIGEIAFDTTDAQILFATSTNASYPDVQPSVRKLWGGTIASTSPDLISGGRIWLPPQRDGFTVKEIHCAVDAGTSIVVNLSNSGGTTDSETITCDADGAVDTAVLTNNLYAAGSLNSLEIGTVTGSVDYLTIAIYGSFTRE